MRDVKWLDHLKLRASYGLVGNDQLSGNRFSYLQYYKSSDGMTTYFGETEAGYTSYLVEGVFANPNLTWEKARKFNFGIDAQFFNQRLTFTLDVFKEHRYDILTSLSGDDKVGFPPTSSGRSPRSSTRVSSTTTASNSKSAGTVISGSISATTSARTSRSHATR